MTVLALPTNFPNNQSAPLRDIVAALAIPRERIESTFFNVGANLSEGAAMLNHISKVFEALPTELASPELGEASSKLAEIGRIAQTISASFAAEQADLDKLASVVAAAHHPISDLRRAVKMMGIVAINARVVAASIVGDRDDFDVFTRDIARLSESASSTIRDFSDVYQQLTGQVDQATRQRAQFQMGHADTLSDIAASLEPALAEVDRQRAVSAASSAQTGRISRQIFGRIASAVMALQVGDATRQRIEHVEAGIETLGDLIDGGSLSDDEALRARAVIGGLQVAQMEGATEALKSEVEDVSAALRDLSLDARVIMDDSRAIFGGSKASVTSPLTSLSLLVQDAVIVLRDCEIERGKLEQVASAVLRTVGLLLTHVEAVQEIEANMRLVSINAAVKCVHLGPRGSALNVIARQLRELTGETVAAAEAAMVQLHQATRLAHCFSAAANGDVTASVGQLQDQATQALVMLQTIDRSVSDALGTLEREGPQVIALLGTAAETFADQSSIFEEISDLQITLTSFCPAMVDHAPEILGEIIVSLRAGYTMDSERQIHQTFFGTEGAEPAPSSEATDLDDMFF